MCGGHGRVRTTVPHAPPHRRENPGFGALAWLTPCCSRVLPPPAVSTLELAGPLLANPCRNLLWRGVLRIFARTGSAWLRRWRWPRRVHTGAALRHTDRERRAMTTHQPDPTHHPATIPPPSRRRPPPRPSPRRSPTPWPLAHPGRAARSGSPPAARRPPAAGSGGGCDVSGWCRWVGVSDGTSGREVFAGRVLRDGGVTAMGRYL